MAPIYAPKKWKRPPESGAPRAVAAPPGAGRAERKIKYDNASKKLKELKFVKKVPNFVERKCGIYGIFMG